MFKFVHTADVHLDSPLKSLALRDPQIAELVGGATRRTFETIIDLCIDEHVDALIIAGDLYDGDQRSMKTAAFLSRQMRRLEGANIRVFIIRGNHDSESSITQYLDLPPNVHIFTGHGGLVELRDLGVAIHGVSYAQRHASESLLHKFKQPVDGLANIGIMHTSLVGAVGHDVYAPCTVKDLTSRGFDYWALGHIHKRQIHNQNPYIVMPGIPQGRDISEDGPRSVTLVAISDKSIRIDERFVADSEFQRVQLDLTDIVEWTSAMTKLREALEEIRTSAKARYVICRIVLCGMSPLNWRIRRDADLFKAEAQEAAQQLNDVFVEGIDNQIKSFACGSNSADPVDELAAIMEEIASDSAFRGKAVSFLETVVRTLPFELRDGYGVNQDDVEKTLQRLLSAGTADVIAALKGSQSKGSV